MVDDLWVDGPDDIANAPAPKRRRSRVGTDSSRHIGCPLWWFRLVFPIVRGKNELAVALYIYRLRKVRHSFTLTITNERLLAELGINRFAKYRALRRLADAKVISLRRHGKHAVEIEFRSRGKRAKA
jgi:hypothetical protein